MSLNADQKPFGQVPVEAGRFDLLGAFYDIIFEPEEFDGHFVGIEDAKAGSRVAVARLSQPSKIDEVQVVAIEGMLSRLFQVVIETTVRE